MELLAALQRGDSQGALGLFHPTALTATTCGTAASATARLSSQLARIVQTDGGVALKIFLEDLSVSDSSDKQTINGQLIMGIAAGQLKRVPIQLVLDVRSGLWKSEVALFQAFCDA